MSYKITIPTVPYDGTVLRSPWIAKVDFSQPQSFTFGKFTGPRKKEWIGNATLEIDDVPEGGLIAWGQKTRAGESHHTAYAFVWGGQIGVTLSREEAQRQWKEQGKPVAKWSGRKGKAPRQEQPKEEDPLAALAVAALRDLTGPQLASWMRDIAHNEINAFLRSLLTYVAERDCQ